LTRPLALALLLALAPGPALADPWATLTRCDAELTAHAHALDACRSRLARWTRTASTAEAREVALAARLDAALAAQGAAEAAAGDRVPSWVVWVAAGVAAALGAAGAVLGCSLAGGC